MREFHNQIHIAPINQVDIAVSQTVVLKNGGAWITTDANTDVKPTDKAKNTKAGKTYSQKLSVKIEKLSNTDKENLPVGIKAIVKLFDDNGSLIWGDLSIPCRINISPGVQYDSLEITRTALSPFL